jgi:DNA invertase Pin-like site-specific DNA recombinase
VATYVERASATTRRPAFDLMMADGRRRAFKLLLVWSLDRFGRSGAPRCDIQPARLFRGSLAGRAS